jgi:hypothetical protein
VSCDLERQAERPKADHRPSKGNQTKGSLYMNPEQLQKALLDPPSVFEVPENVVASMDLTRDQKVEILRRWEFIAAQEAVALEEGMPGRESSLLRRILMALGEIAGPIDVEHTAPTKNHALPREAVKKSLSDEA